LFHVAETSVASEMLSWIAVPARMTELFEGASKVIVGRVESMVTVKFR